MGHRAVCSFLLIASLEALLSTVRAADDTLEAIVVTPTLLKVAPLPLQRIIGNLSDTAQVLRALGRT